MSQKSFLHWSGTRFRERAPLIALAFALLAGRARAQDLASGGAGSPFVNGVLLLAVFAVLWLIFYKGLYPLFLRFYRPDFSKFLFWSLFLLYGLAWLHLSLYVLFDIGFYYAWARWVAVFLTFLWLIWFMVVFSRRRTA